METNKRVLLFITAMLTLLTAATIINVSLNFREYGFKSALEKAKMTAQIVRDGLTAHMVNGTMDKRHFFLSSISNAKEVENLWVIRGQKVIDQYGLGLENEQARDSIDKEVLKTGQIVQNIEESASHAKLRVTIPYTATSYDGTNCLTCHTVKENDVLGAISMEFDISEFRGAGAIAVAKTFGINIIFLIIILFITNRYTKPYIQLFDEMQRAIENANNGDFSYRVQTSISSKGKEVAKRLNLLLEKIDTTLLDIKEKLFIFLSNPHEIHKDPLVQAHNTIEELYDVYKFKNTIELDKSKEDIYERFVYLIEHKFNFKDFVLYEVDNNHKNRKVIYATGKEEYCDHESMKNAQECRAFRTGKNIISTDFHDLCKFCKGKKEYFCAPLTINNAVSLTLSIRVENEEELKRAQSAMEYLHNYFDVAKPVIESKILLDILRDSSLRDGLTGLYNRRFLEEFVEKAKSQALRSKNTYAVLMIDIDFFKMVNDSYGHDVGDVVIKGLSSVLKENVRSSDLAIRYGGEEFLVLLYNPTEEGMLLVAENIRKAFAKLIFTSEKEKFSKTLSIGLSSFPQDSDSIWKVIKYADTALYQAKNTGRDQVIRFESKMFEGEEF